MIGGGVELRQGGGEGGRARRLGLPRGGLHRGLSRSVGVAGRPALIQSRRSRGNVDLDAHEHRVNADQPATRCSRRVHPRSRAAFRGPAYASVVRGSTRQRGTPMNASTPRIAAHLRHLRARDRRAPRIPRRPAVLLRGLRRRRTVPCSYDLLEEADDGPRGRASAGWPRDAPAPTGRAGPGGCRATEAPYPARVTSSVADGSPLSLAALRLHRARGERRRPRAPVRGSWRRPPGGRRRGPARGARVARARPRRRGEDRTYVLTSLGQQVVDRGLSADAPPSSRTSNACGPTCSRRSPTSCGRR